MRFLVVVSLIRVQLHAAVFIVAKTTCNIIGVNVATFLLTPADFTCLGIRDGEASIKALFTLPVVVHLSFNLKDEAILLRCVTVASALTFSPVEVFHFPHEVESNTLAR